jgi:hypothetical protein
LGRLNVIQESFAMEFGLRDALRLLEDACEEAESVRLAACGYTWEVRFEPTEKGVKAFAWWPRRIAGPFTDRDAALEVWYEHQCEHRRVPDAEDYASIVLRQLPRWEVWFCPTPAGIKELNLKAYRMVDPFSTEAAGHEFWLGEEADHATEDPERKFGQVVLRRYSADGSVESVD